MCVYLCVRERCNGEKEIRGKGRRKGKERWNVCERERHERGERERERDRMRGKGREEAREREISLCFNH